jgi:hypothetical protein
MKVGGDLTAKGVKHAKDSGADYPLYRGKRPVVALFRETIIFRDPQGTTEGKKIDDHR